MSNLDSGAIGLPQALAPPLKPTGLDAEYQQLHQSYQALYKIARHMDPYLAKLEAEMDILSLQADMDQFEQFIANLEQILLQSGELVSYRQELEAEYQNILKVRAQIQQSSKAALHEAQSLFEHLLDRRDALADQLRYFDEQGVATDSVRPTMEAFEYHLQTLVNEIDDCESWPK